MSETAARDWVGAGPLLDAGLDAEITSVLEELSNLLPELRFGPRSTTRPRSPLLRRQGASWTG
jgi:hypothetical protein